MKNNALLVLISFCSLFASFAVQGAIRPEKIHVAEARKTQAYIREGLFIGGDHSIDDVTINDIRRSITPGFERIVIDLQGNRGGEPAAIERPPYYQVAVSPDEKRLVVTVWGTPKLAFDPKKIAGVFKKKSAVTGLELLPKVENDSWSFVVNLSAKNAAVEVFELNRPVRISIDIRSGMKGRN